MSRPIPIEEMVRLFKTRHTTSHLFKIDNFSLFKKHRIKRAESSVFDLAGHKWKLCVYPNGYENVCGYVSIFLWNQVSIDVNLEYELFVVSQLEPAWHTIGKEVFDKSVKPTNEGYTKFISLDDLETKGYLIGDCCMFGVKFYGIEPSKSATAECFSLIEKPLNHRVTWMMTKFSSFDPEKVHHSNEFVVGNKKWRIEVHPRGTKKGKDKSFSVYLLNNAADTKTFAKFKLRVLDQVNQRHVEKTSSSWFGAEFDAFRAGSENFMLLEKLDEPYLVKDKLYVGVEFEVISVTNYC